MIKQKLRKVLSDINELIKKASEPVVPEIETEQGAIMPKVSLKEMRKLYPKQHLKTPANIRTKLIFENSLPPEAKVFATKYFDIQIKHLILLCENHLPTKKPFNYTVNVHIKNTEGSHGEAYCTLNTFGIVGIGLVFNTRSLLKNPEAMFEDTLPHEIAHLYLYHFAEVNKIKGNFMHNKTWQELAIYLGSKGTTGRVL